MKESVLQAKLMARCRKAEINNPDFFWVYSVRRAVRRLAQGGASHAGRRGPATGGGAVALPPHLALAREQGYLFQEVEDGR